MNEKRKGKIDYPLLLGVLLAVGFGIIMVYSASYYKLLVKDHLNPESYFKSGSLYALIGTAAMMFFSYINYARYKKMTGAFVMIALALSIYVLIFGDNINGARRWIFLAGISIMPSEVTKIAIVFSISAFVVKMDKRIQEFSVFFVALLGTGLLAGLTFFQPNLSTAALISILGVSMLFVAGCRFSHIFFTSAGLGVLVAIGIIFEPYRFKRLVVYLNYVVDRTYVFDDTRRQIMYSIYAISSGGLNGLGLGMGELKNLRLPEPYNDFIFSIISEELGFIGSVSVLCLYAFILYRIFLIALNCKDRYGFMIASGAGLQIAYQVIINVGVATNLLPTTGISLPFLSKGGSSIIMMMALMGVVLNISYQNSLMEEVDE